MKEKLINYFGTTTGNPVRYLLPVILAVVLICGTKNMYASGLKLQEISVSGTVVDALNNEPLPGVSILIVGTSLGTVTDIDGKFTLKVPGKESQLTFSYIGYLSSTLVVGEQSVINVSLAPDLKTLDEVIVVGYGTQKKGDLTGAITSVTDKAIEEKQPVSIYEAIKGAAPGVQILSSSGAPGESSQIRIRGTSTFTDAGVAPLYVVDGAIVDNIDAINPSDIQSMQILKDAASASIYGSRSANGVILITTKRGEEGKPAFNLKYLRSYSSLAHKLPQSNRLEREVFDQRGRVGLAPNPADSTAFNRNADNDYQELMTQTAIRDQIDFSISGGTKQTKYFSSVQYLDDEGIIINSYFKRLTVRGNVDYSANDRLTVGTRNSLAYTNRSVIDEGKVIQQALKRPPQMALYFPNGGYVYDNGGQKNPVAEAEMRTRDRDIYKGLTYEYLDFKIAPWLTYHGDLAADIEFQRYNELNSGLLETSGITTGADDTDLKYKLQGNTYLSFSKEFNNAHNVSAMIGSSFERSHSENVDIDASQYVTENVTTMNAAGIKIATTGGSDNAMASFFGRLGYNYKSRYLFNFTYRYDGSSRFGAKNRWGAFPSASVAWRFSDESFMVWSKSVLDDAKVRASWGITGNQEFGDFESKSQLVFGRYNYNGINGIVTSNVLGNEGVKWEETEQKNFGLDLSFYNGRISFTGDYYIKNTKSLLYMEQLPLEIGYREARTNFGGIENKGLELMVTAVPVRTKNFTWTTSVNYAQNKNKITALPAGDYSDDIWWIGKNQAAGTYYLYQYEGIYGTDYHNAYTPDYKTRLTPVFEKDANGNLIVGKNWQPVLKYYTLPDGSEYKDENGNYILTPAQVSSNGVVLKGGDVMWKNMPDSAGNLNGTIGVEDVVANESGIPKWYGGWTNTLRYKGLSLNFSFYFSFGNKIFNEQRRQNARISSTNVTPDPYIVYNAWKYPGQLTDMYQTQRGTQDNMRTNSDYWLEDGSFIRLQNVRLSYDLNKKITEKFYVKNLGVYVYANYLFTWTNYKGYDPEVSQDEVLKPGRDAGRYPRKREFGLGLNLTF